MELQHRPYNIIIGTHEHYNWQLLTDQALVIRGEIQGTPSLWYTSVHDTFIFAHPGHDDFAGSFALKCCKIEIRRRPWKKRKETMTIFVSVSSPRPIFLVVSTPCTDFDILGLQTTHKLRETLLNSCLFPFYHLMQSRWITCHPELSLNLV